MKIEKVPSRLAAAAIIVGSIVTALPVRAETTDALLDALRTDEMLEVMRTEGLAYGDELAQDMFASGANPAWSAVISELYDTEAMRSIVAASFKESWGDRPLDQVVAYFSESEGAEIVALELAARQALIDDATEEAARQAYQAALEDGDPRLELLDRFVEANNLVDANVEGALNASFNFYRGLVDGGAVRLSEAEILSDVWQQEEETRIDTREWLYGFLLMAYSPLEDADLETYVALSESAEGKALNRALFAGYNDMYDVISYGMGLAAATHMTSQEL